MSLTKNNPNHVAIIMDGNGRWAKNNHLPTSLGHKQGAETAKEIIDASQELNIKYLTLYAFSSENWKRPKSEVEHLMKLLHFYIKSERKNLENSDVKVMVIGNTSTLPDKLLKSIKEVEETTKNNSGMTLIIALSYGGREEIVHATRKIAEICKRGELSPEEIDEKTFTSALYTSNIPDPDLLIRTSGELRISNFLLWQSAYTEFYFTKINWPNFTKKDLKKALMEFQTRKRNYGK
jgi:undecaprenyl diphosphate synthase